MTIFGFAAGMQLMNIHVSNERCGLLSVLLQATVYRCNEDGTITVLQAYSDADVSNTLAKGALTRPLCSHWK